MSSQRSLDNLVQNLRKCKIKELNSLEKMSDKQLSHFLMATDSGELADQVGLSRVRKIIKSTSVSKVSPQLAVQGYVSDTQNSEKVKNEKLSIVPNFRSPDAAAIFDINITRLTHALNQTLYVALFGPLDYQSSYNQVISDLNPGLTWTVELMTNKRGLKFTFTDGVGSDIVNVECAQVAYVNLLRACQGSILRMEQNKMNISDVTAQTEFAASIFLIKNSLFGKLEKDSFTPNQFKTDLQNQNDIRIFTMTWELDQESCVAFPMVDGFTALQVNLTSFISAFSTSRA